jgi:hypothetical protein
MLVTVFTAASGSSVISEKCMKRAGVKRVARISRAHKIAALRGCKSHRFHYHKPAKAAPNSLSSLKTF